MLVPEGVRMLGGCVEALEVESVKRREARKARKRVVYVLLVWFSGVSDGFDGQCVG